MKDTNQLIQNLSKDLKKQSLFRPAYLLSSTAMICLMAMTAVIGLFLYFRAEWTIYGALKTVFFITLAGGLGSLLVQKSSVQNKFKKALLITLLIIPFIIYFALYLNASSLTLQEVLKAPTFFGCLSFVFGFGSIIFLILRFLLVRARPQNAKEFSSILGAFSATLAGAAYTMSCSIDSGLYVLIAYGSAIAFVALVGYLFPRESWKW